MTSGGFKIELVLQSIFGMILNFNLSIYLIDIIQSLQVCTFRTDGDCSIIELLWTKLKVNNWKIWKNLKMNPYGVAFLQELQDTAIDQEIYYTFEKWRSY